jgi:hypothetical protein
MESRVLDVFFLFFAALLISMVCGLSAEDRFFFSNLGSLSNSGCEDFSERKNVNFRYFFRKQSVLQIRFPDLDPDIVDSVLLLSEECQVSEVSSIINCSD